MSEFSFQTFADAKYAAELTLAYVDFIFQNEENPKRATSLIISKINHYRLKVPSFT